jgi:uncharacterized protein GlcG (DUF336 family)
MRVSRGCALSVLASLLAACGGGGGATSPAGSSPSTPSAGCSGSCANSSTYLTANDVQSVLAQGIAEAHARGSNATLAVVDRVGNVLAVYRMGSAPSRSVLIASQVDASNNPLLHSGLDGIRLPSPQLALNLDAEAAISKAITGAYLSSEGNAFSSRTASQIVQEHFNVGQAHAPSGPLFGVQFSQLACSDFVQSAAGSALAPGPGPHRAPLGLSADPGGFPLYKNGTVVGGVGVMADGVYGVDRNIDAADANLDDEAVAYAASYNYLPPVDRRADRITVDGVTLRFSDADESQLKAAPGMAGAFSGIDPSFGALISVSGYSDGTVHAGLPYGEPSSGVRADAGNNFPGQDAFIFVDAGNSPRYPSIAGSEGSSALKPQEVGQILSSALGVAETARAQIRVPLGLSAQVTISVVDSQGNILGMVRTRDAPLFGADVSLQKARTAAFMSSSAAASFLAALPDASYLATDANGYPQLDAMSNVALSPVSLGAYVTAGQSFVGRPGFLNDGSIAVSERALGNLSRPYFPDGIEGTPNGPFSKPIAAWSVFSTGLQLDLAFNAILQHVLYVASDGALLPDVGTNCAGVALSGALAPTATVSSKQLANGLQIFPGSVPIYRGTQLIGAVGVSGDGVDQDDMVAFLGLQRALQALNTGLSQAPASMRADTLQPQGTRLRYVQCPQAPFLNSSQENVCEGF